MPNLFFSVFAMMLGLSLSQVGHADTSTVGDAEFRKTVQAYEDAQRADYSQMQDAFYFGQCFGPQAKSRARETGYFNVLVYSFAEQAGPILDRKYAALVEAVVDEKAFLGAFLEVLQQDASRVRPEIPSAVEPVAELGSELSVRTISSAPQEPVVTYGFRMNDQKHLIVTAQLSQTYGEYKQGDLVLACYLYLRRSL